MSEAIKDGIYFNLPEEIYLAEERLSKSGIKRLRVSPADFWADSWLNPNPKVLTPEQERSRNRAKVIGRAYHAARLEPEKFASEYVRELSQGEMPEGTLFTATDMKPHLAERGLKLSGSTEEQAERLAADGFPRDKLWHLAVADWQAKVRPGAIKLDASTYDEIVADGERLHMIPRIRELVTGGASEVSVFWHCALTGLPMKARFDKLHSDRWVELKTFANATGKALYQAVIDAVRFNRYHIDAAGYMEAAEAIRSGVLDVQGPATDDEINLITGIMERTEPLACSFIFQQKDGIPNILEREWRFFEPTPSEEAIRELEESGASEEHLARARRFQEVAKSERHATAIHTKGRMEIAAAKRDFIAYSEIYSRGEPWLPFNPSGEITDADFSQYFLEEAI